MCALYSFANSNGFLVAGTGNKVEDYGIGFFTKYGDGGVDLNPIADLLKSEVYDLAATLGVSENILSAHPTDGLWQDNRTDEDQIGASYAELEWAMKFSDRGGVPEMVSGRKKDVLLLYRQRNRNNRHKLNTAPVCYMPQEWKDNKDF